MSILCLAAKNERQKLPQTQMFLREKCVQSAKNMPSVSMEKI
jgi:hypothetical protein